MTTDEIGTPEADAHEDEVIEGVIKGPRGKESRRDKVERWILYVLVAAVIVGGPAVWVTYKIAHTTEQNLSLLCPAFKDVATAAIPPATGPTVGTPTAIQIVGDLRKAYLASCVDKYGALPPITDQRLSDYLKAKGH